MVKIDSGAGLENFAVMIDDGSTIARYCPMIDNGVSFDRYGSDGHVIYDGSVTPSINNLDGWSKVVPNGTYTLTEVTVDGIKCLKFVTTAAASVYLRSGFSFNANQYSKLVIRAKISYVQEWGSKVGVIPTGATAVSAATRTQITSTSFADIEIDLASLSGELNIYWENYKSGLYTAYISKIELR